MYVMFRRWAPVLTLFSLLIVTWGVYSPALKGGFLFDDYVNLDALGALGGVRDLERAKSFVFSGIAGPTGRPLSLATFLIDDNDWPSEGAWFKSTNLKIHLVSGLLLIWLTILYLRALRTPENLAIWSAILSGGIWLLHPFLVSTVMYVVQRMAELSTLFIFLGLVIYLKGRSRLEHNPIAAYFTMSLGISLGTLLALLSKENGVLLPLMALVIEFTLPKSNFKPKSYWLWIFLVIPSLTVLGYMLTKLHLRDAPLGGRLFSQWERIITEPRIVCEYIYYLFVPHIEGRGLFQDGYIFSKHIFQPLSTLGAIVAVLMLLFFGFWFKERNPLISLAILFFFAGHLLESTWINLELYFEHRNYLSAAFAFLPIAYGIVCLTKYVRVSLVILCAMLILATLSFLTYERSKLWSNSNRLELYWAASSPNSARAQNTVGTFLLNSDRVNESIEFMERQNEKFKTSSLLTINLLLIKLYANKATDEDFQKTSEQLQHQPFDAQAVKGIRNLIENITNKRRHTWRYASVALKFLDDVKENSAYSKNRMFARLYYYLRAKLLLALGNFEGSKKCFLNAMHLYKETDAALSMVAEFAAQGDRDNALELWSAAYKVYRAQPEQTLIRSKTVYDSEFARVRAGILEASGN